MRAIQRISEAISSALNRKIVGKSDSNGSSHSVAPKREEFSTSYCFYYTALPNERACNCHYVARSEKYPVLRTVFLYRFAGISVAHSEERIRGKICLRSSGFSAELFCLPNVGVTGESGIKNGVITPDSSRFEPWNGKRKPANGTFPPLLPWRKRLYKYGAVTPDTTRFRNGVTTGAGRGGGPSQCFKNGANRHRILPELGTNVTTQTPLR